jgi:hypothetical protein
MSDLPASISLRVVGRADREKGIEAVPARE